MSLTLLDDLVRPEGRRGIRLEGFSFQVPGGVAGRWTLRIRIMIRGLRILLATLILLFWLGQYGFSLFPAPLPPKEEEENALWVGLEWVETPLSEGEYRQFATQLQARRVRYLFVYATWFMKNGVPRYWIGESLSHFAFELKRFYPEVRVLAWVGIPTTTLGRGEVNLDDPTVRDQIVAWCVKLTGLKGIDGLHVDAEPVPDGSTGFLLLLDGLRQAIGPNALLSVAGEDVIPQPWGLRLPYLAQVKWGVRFYREVARRVDQIALMSYDSGLPLAGLYGLWTAWQTRQVLKAVHGTQAAVWIGLPAYSERTWTHLPWAEHLESGLWGVRWGLGSLSPEERNAFRGIALYAEWAMGGKEWETFENLWLNAGK